MTGASSGIGRAFVEHLAGAGLHVVLASRSADRPLGRAKDRIADGALARDPAAR